LLDTPIDYETLKSAGAIMGSGGLVVLDETTCMVDFAKFFMEFIQSESCGKCIPCREGTRRMLEILDAITRPRRKEENIDALIRFQGIMRLSELAETIKITSLCVWGRPRPTRCCRPCAGFARNTKPMSRADLPGGRVQGLGGRALPEHLPGGH